VGLEWRTTRPKRDSQPYKDQWAYLDRGPIPSVLKLGTLPGDPRTGNRCEERCALVFMVA
jgi:hypothetical protein